MDTIQFNELKLLTGSFETAADWLIYKSLNRPKNNPCITVHINLFNYYKIHTQDLNGINISTYCSLIFDGIGMKLGAKVLGQDWTPDLNGTDLFPMVMQRVQREKIKVFFLGASAHNIEAAKLKCQSQYPGLDIVGARSGYFSSDQHAEVISTIKNSGAQLLIVGRGDLCYLDFLIDNRTDFGVSLIWNVGGLFDFVSRLKPRAPLWVRRSRLEWLFRFAIEPKRMWKRNLVPPLWFLAHSIVQGRQLTWYPPTS